MNVPLGRIIAKPRSHKNFVGCTPFASLIVPKRQNGAECRATSRQDLERPWLRKFGLSWPRMLHALFIFKGPIPDSS